MTFPPEAAVLTDIQHTPWCKDMVPTDTVEARRILITALNDFCDDFNHDRFTPILEADIAGYLFHRLVANGCPTNMVYLATRVRGEAERIRKPDLVIGTLDRNDASIVPLLICEVKAFQRWGLSDQQMRQRFMGLIHEDIPSLQEAGDVLADGRIEIVFDLYVSAQRTGYLTGTWDGRNRKEVVSERCRDIGATFIWIHSRLDSDEVVCDIVR